MQTLQRLKSIGNVLTQQEMKDTRGGLDTPSKEYRTCCMCGNGSAAWYYHGKPPSSVQVEDIKAYCSGGGSCVGGC